MIAFQTQRGNLLELGSIGGVIGNWSDM
jgi:hypothetical protein